MKKNIEIETFFLARDGITKQVSQCDLAPKLYYHLHVTSVSVLQTDRSGLDPASS